MSQLSLWTFEAPKAINTNVFPTVEGKNAKGQVASLTIRQVKAKTLRELMGLTGSKSDRAVLNRELLKNNDQLKEYLGREVVGVIASPMFTGGSMKATKKGITFKFDRVDRGVDPKEAIKQMLQQGMTKDQILEVLSTTELDKPAVEVTSTVVAEAPKAIGDAPAVDASAAATEPETTEEQPTETTEPAHVEAAS